MAPNPNQHTLALRGQIGRSLTLTNKPSPFTDKFDGPYDQRRRDLRLREQN